MDIGQKLNPDKAAALVSRFGSELRDSEQVMFVGTCIQFKPQADHLIITKVRLLAGNPAMPKPVMYQIRYSQIRGVIGDEKRQAITVVHTDGSSVTFKNIPREDHDTILHHLNAGRSMPDAEALQAFEQDEAAASEVASEQSARESQAKATSWPNSRIVGGQVSSKASLAILRLCHGAEEPWLILTGPGGVLTAFDDRLAIIKTGGLTGFMAGALGGERSATFYYRDVTGIEYNSGMMTGVLEVLTASYSGTANRDFWRGSNKSRNADSNDPFTLSNTLPLVKREYNAALTQINELRARISKAKEVTVNITQAATAPSPAPGIADEVRKLADLRAAGLLTDDEFTAAKARLLAS